MPVNAEQIRKTLSDYIAAWATNDKELLLSVFAKDAVFCDPAGTPEFVGHDSISKFWDFAHKGSKRQLQPRLEEIRACGNEGILRFTMQVRVPEANQGIDLSIIEYVQFNDDAKISALRAFWDESNASCPPGMVFLPPDVTEAYE
jgi:steroid delta-isomerase